MQGHHLILGELVDFISGEIIADTHDERYRQKVAHLLVNQKGYLKKEIQTRGELLVTAGNKSAIVKIDFQVNLDGITGMIIKYGPGSLVTRHRPALAASRLVAPYQVPVVVVTNGEDAEILEGATGKVMSQGLGSIPTKTELSEKIAKTSLNRISAEQAVVESRVVYAFEVDGSCPCDDSICRL
ncbi:MAG: type I restriction enzyme HsdR N-terminal domain-containing protein [Pseudomonadota bacterium]|uniref:Type I restriction enzyme HsdR N-terminal domain-containing protein n=1 Tax=Candidatus Desulfatibia profunda TaxID=2841695 RepID=A0A8J6TIQ6_9BACT|nr:type I restriction enzyme HsdR N-terminal domain-containing protein [Candidatus Desulfatibia profunda]